MMIDKKLIDLINRKAKEQQEQEKEILSNTSARNVTIQALKRL